jgi:hypothetical protein
VTCYEGAERGSEKAENHAEDDAEDDGARAADRDCPDYAPRHQRDEAEK